MLTAVGQIGPRVPNLAPPGMEAFVGGHINLLVITLIILHSHEVFFAAFTVNSLRSKVRVLTFGAFLALRDA